MVDLSSWFDNEPTEVKPDEYYENMTVKIKATLGQVNYPRGGMDDYGYAIIKVNVLEVLEGELHPTAKNYRDMISIKGEMSRIEGGEALEFTIELDEIDEQWGASYKLIFKRQDFDFKDVGQQRIFFETFLTETQIVNIFETFDNPIEVLENKNIEKLCEVKGIGYSIAEKIMHKYEMNKDYAEAYVELSQYDISINAIQKLSKKYGSPDALVGIIKDNPYLLTEVEGYGFKKADQIALQSGIESNSSKRVMAFIDYTLNEMGEQGMSWIDSEHLVYLIEENLGEVDMSAVIESVDILKEKNQVWNEERGKIGSMKFYELELKIVKELYRLMTAPKPEIPDGWEDRIKEAEKLQGWEYTDEQKEAIELILNSNVCAMTGLGGTGKTSTVLGAVKALGDISFGQCALSGKASARLEEATGYSSSTIHRLLGFNPMLEGSPFTYSKENPLRKDVVILDEASMVGGSLFYSLIQAVPTGARLILIGDPNQIPPLNSLNVFYDWLNSGFVSSVKLTKIHRQAQKSGIITNSISLSQGNQLVEKGFEDKDTRGELQDFHLDIYDKKWKTYDKVIETFKEKLELSKDHTKVQVIVPFNFNGEISVYNLNKEIQTICNPASERKKEIQVVYSKNKGATLREGDLIMNTVNNYKLESPLDNSWFGKEEVSVFNGFIGELKEIRGEDLLVYFSIMDKDVIIPRSHWQGKKAIQHAWVSTCHKIQGSQNDYIIVAIDMSHYVMLTNEWAYTAITRATKDCTVIAQNSALRQAISTKDSRQKQTFMVDLINKLNNEKK